MESLYKGKLAWYISFVLLLFDMANVLVLLSDLQCACSASGRPRTSAVVENSWVLLVDSQVCSKIPIYLALPIEYFKLWFQLCVCVFFLCFHLSASSLWFVNKISVLFCFQSTMMPATVNVNRLAAHQPNLEAGSVYSLTGFWGHTM